MKKTAPIRRALVSVSDKTDLLPFVRGLHRMGVEIISTGGTANFLKAKRIPVKAITRLTGYPEILEGRVKTLHPKVHGGILASRQNKKHLRQVKKLNLKLIDLVVVNLYPFEAVASRRKSSLSDLIEEIDIGGVALLRSGAKNFQSVAVVSRPWQYPHLLKELERNAGRLSEPTRRKLAVVAFAETAYYDAVIHQALAHQNQGSLTRSLSRGKKGWAQGEWPERLVLAASRRQILRYGENPHQTGIWYQWPSLKGEAVGLGAARQLHGKELSFNNLLDLDAAIQIVAAFRKPTAVLIKHGNPCGVACAVRLEPAFRKAFACDPISAFGGVVGLNRAVDQATAKAIVGCGFLECLVAPRFQADALRLLKAKKNLRIIEVSSLGGRSRRCVDFKQIGGGLLVQSPDEGLSSVSSWRLATRAKPTASQKRDLLFAWTVAQFARSNAIVIAKEERTLGIGAGQTSRVDSVRLAIKKAGAKARGAVLASDGFFPKPDGPRHAVKAGVRAIIQPGGSIQDPHVVAVAKRARVPMVLTGERHFRH